MRDESTLTTRPLNAEEQALLEQTLIREAGKDHTQNTRETAVMRRALMAPNRCEKAKAMV